MYMRYIHPHRTRDTKSNLMVMCVCVYRSTQHTNTPKKSHSTFYIYVCLSNRNMCEAIYFTKYLVFKCKQNQRRVGFAIRMIDLCEARFLV